MKKQKKTEPPIRSEDSCPVSIIPAKRRKAIYSELISGELTCATRVAVDCTDDNLMLVGVSALDWPGLASIVLGEFHHKGWNLDVLEGFTEEEYGVRRGFVITGIIEPDKEQREKFRADAMALEDLLQRLAMGRMGTISLLSRGAERLEIFEDVRLALTGLYKDKEIPHGILAENGELVLFISSRSDEYLAERKASDLAWIIKTNYQLVSKVRISGGTAVFRIKNLKTTREHLTGVNIAGYERDMSFQDFVTTLMHSWEGATIRHQRRYTTGDGIISIRVEMTGPEQMGASKEKQMKIRHYLKKLLVKHELEKLHRIHHYGGAEQYARALIPLLMKECKSTGQIQAYLAMVSLTTFTAQLKLLLVSGRSPNSTHDEKVIELVGKINDIQGIAVVSFKSPSHRGDTWVDILNINIERDDYSEMETAYTVIKNSINDVFGEFRDFDQGMRLNDVQRLADIREELQDIPNNTITDFYYSIEEFLRASISVGELVLLIKLAYTSITDMLKNKREISESTVCDYMDGDRKISTLFCCTMPARDLSFDEMLKPLIEYTVNVTSVEKSGIASVILRVEKDGRGLDSTDAEEILKKLLKLRMKNKEKSSS